MKEIKLNGTLAKGRVAIVDDEDFEFLNRFKWSVDKDGYAVSSGYRYKMHRLIMAASKKRIVDHMNRDRLDNRSCSRCICCRHRSTADTNKSAID